MAWEKSPLESREVPEATAGEIVDVGAIAGDLSKLLVVWALSVNAAQARKAAWKTATENGNRVRLSFIGKVGNPERN